MWNLHNKINSPKKQDIIIERPFTTLHKQVKHSQTEVATVWHSSEILAPYSHSRRSPHSPLQNCSELLRTSVYRGQFLSDSVSMSVESVSQRACVQAQDPSVYIYACMHLCGEYAHQNV